VKINSRMLGGSAYRGHIARKLQWARVRAKCESAGRRQRKRKKVSAVTVWDS